MTLTPCHACTLFLSTWTQNCLYVLGPVIDNINYFRRKSCVPRRLKTPNDASRQQTSVMVLTMDITVALTRFWCVSYSIFLQISIPWNSLEDSTLSRETCSHKSGCCVELEAAFKMCPLGFCGILHTFDDWLLIMGKPVEYQGRQFIHERFTFQALGLMETSGNGKNLLSERANSFIDLKAIPNDLYVWKRWPEDSCLSMHLNPYPAE